MLLSHPNHLLGRLLLGASLASASTFSTNCTLPTESTTLVSGANIRGTFDILWSGLFTIFICIWTVQHLNVPEQRNGPKQGWRGDLKWAWKGFFTKFKWMVFTLILPEFLVGKAFAEWTVAKRSMGQVLRLKYDGTKRLLSDTEISNWTTAHAFYAEMGGFVIRPYLSEAGSTDFRVVATADILTLRSKGYIQTLPTVTTHHLNDLSNGDSFTKAVAIGQVSWMVVQVMVRAARGLPSTQLEITACAFAASTFLTYLLWWHKPQAVRSVTELPSPLDSNESSYWVILDSNLHNRGYGVGGFVLIWGEGRYRKLKYNEPMPNDSFSVKVDNYFIAGILLGGMVLGGVQCAAWNFDFPTRIELLLWRYSSLVTVAAFPVMFCVAILVNQLEAPARERMTRLASYTAFTLFLAGRLFILFETMYSLFHLPPGAFVSTWSSSIPHIT